MNRKKKHRYNVLYNYNKNKIKIDKLTEKYLYYESIAEKITTSYNQDGGTGGEDSKIEKYAIKMAEISKQRDRYIKQIQEAEEILYRLKPHQRYFISTCLIHHIPVSVVAFQEDTTSENIRKMIFNAL